MSGNPNIIEIGKNTRFGAHGGVNPRKARWTGAEPWSIRNAIRRMAAMHIKDFENMTQSKELTMAQAVAAAKWKKALAGDIRAMQQLEDSVDGKLTEKKAEAQAALAYLVEASFRIGSQ